MRYNTTLWIGEIPGGGYNYEVRGVPEDDYRAKVIICQEMEKRLKQIIVFYEELAQKQRR